MTAPRFSTCLFDLDGTLIDSVELILSSYRHTMRVHRGTVPPDDLWLRGLGTPLRTQLAELATDDAEVDALVATYRAFNLAHHDRMVQAFPGVSSLLQELRNAGIKLGLVTSKMAMGARRGLTITGLRHYFDVVVAADDVRRHKPDPEPVCSALVQLGGEPDRAIFVGDSPHDIVAGQRAKVKTGAVLWGPFSREMLARAGPDYWVETPEDIGRLCCGDHQE